VITKLEKVAIAMQCSLRPPDVILVFIYKAYNAFHEPTLWNSLQSAALRDSSLSLNTFSSGG